MLGRQFLGYCKNESTKEATLLRLNCEKATSILEGNQCRYRTDLEFTMSWYKYTRPRL